MAHLLLAWALVAACGGPAPVADPAVALRVADRPPAMDEAALADAVTALRSLTRQHADACRAGPVGQADSDAAEHAPVAFTPAEAEASCGPLGGLWDAHHGRLEGRSRDLDWLLSALARSADDHRHLLVFAHGEDGEQRRLALEHVHKALDHVDFVLRETDVPLRTWADDLGGSLQAADAWGGVLADDAVTLASLVDHLRQLAFIQGFDPERVRVRMLRSFGVMAEQAVSNAIRWHRSAAAPAEGRAARGAYLVAARRWVDTFHHVVDTYAAGEVTTPAARQALLEQASRDLRAWFEAHASERARTGVDAVPDLTVPP